VAAPQSVVQAAVIPAQEEIAVLAVFDFSKFCSKQKIMRIKGDVRSAPLFIIWGVSIQLHKT
jgi:hypothetical protein